MIGTCQPTPTQPLTIWVLITRTNHTGLPSLSTWPVRVTHEKSHQELNTEKLPSCSKLFAHCFCARNQLIQIFPTNAQSFFRVSNAKWFLLQTCLLSNSCAVACLCKVVEWQPRGPDCPHKFHRALNQGLGVFRPQIGLFQPQVFFQLQKGFFSTSSSKKKPCESVQELFFSPKRFFDLISLF